MGAQHLFSRRLQIFTRDGIVLALTVVGATFAHVDGPLAGETFGNDSETLLADD